MCTIQACISLQCHFIRIHIHGVHVGLAVTYHLRFWQNGQDLLLATAVRRVRTDTEMRVSTESWPWRKKNFPAAPAGNRTRDLSITSPALCVWQSSQGGASLLSKKRLLSTKRVQTVLDCCFTSTGTVGFKERPPRLSHSYRVLECRLYGLNVQLNNGDQIYALRSTASRGESQTTYATILTDSMSLQQKMKSGMGSPDWHVSMFGIRLRKLLRTCRSEWKRPSRYAGGKSSHRK